MYYGSCSCQVLKGQSQAMRAAFGVQVSKYSKPNLCGVSFLITVVDGEQKSQHIWEICIELKPESLLNNTYPLYIYHQGDGVGDVGDPSWLVSWTSAVQPSHLNNTLGIYRNNMPKLKQTQ